MPSPFDLRANLHNLIVNDLLGPADGPDEIVAEPTVRGRYVLGILAPRNQTELLDEEEDPGEDQRELAVGAGETLDPEEDASDSATPKAVSMMPSSIGLTCTVDGAATAIQVTVRWGRYERRDHPDPEALTAKGRRRRVWQRIPVEATSPPIPLQAGPIRLWTPDSDSPGVAVRGLARQRDGEWSLTLYLDNGQAEPKRRDPRGKDSAWLFQPEIAVAAPDDSSIFCRRPVRRHQQQIDPEEQAMQMAYRHEVEFAVGHGVAVHAERDPADPTRALRLATSVVPDYEVRQTTPPTTEDIPELAGVNLDMFELAHLADEDFAANLTPLTTAYRSWIEAQEARIGAPDEDLSPYADAGRTAMERARATMVRIEAGITLLADDSQAADAFRFANRAMWLQRIHSIFAQRRRQSEELALSDVDLPANRRWYPFQLAFVLLNLPSVTDVHHPDRSHPTDALADLLWFPTGGGKTEAYLGLTAYTLAIRRLQGEVGDYAGHAGVSVLMRYTLRLLTLQQFQRATALICACEEIRQEALAAGDVRWGVEPFRIGLWVGSSSTPNNTNQSADALKSGSFGASRGTPYQLTYCPWCGSPIDEKRDLHVEVYEKGQGRTYICCGDPLGRCRFSHRGSKGEGLPVLVVDEEIYRRLPSLLIATVDKFARMPWEGASQMLFGRVSGYCTRHGYCSPEIDCPGHHRRTGKHPKAEKSEVRQLRPPDLIIQDELHLISGPLGTLVGLYESAIDYLCSWRHENETVRPKVIASTATIRHADSQVNHLYLRRVNIFPPAGIDAGDNFFARQREPSEEYPGRLYVGICAPGSRVKALLIRVYVAAMAAAQLLYEEHGAAVDPYMTLAGYFNSVRELGGMRRAVDDAVRTRLRRAGERGLASRSIMPFNVEELTSRKNAADIPQILDRLETPFDPDADKNRPLDVLLATNMISVGVDVPRLGLMTVAGQPKATSEYIQATSRVGRRHPGIVLVVYNWARPRDLSHYERFEHYHATVYQNVEPLSVTPFSPRAVDRGLTGVLVSMIRLMGEEFNANLGAGDITADHPYVRTALEEISRRAGRIEASTDVEDAIRDELQDRIDQWVARVQQASGGARLGYKESKDGLTRNLLVQAGKGRWSDFVCLNSLRDVEPTVGLILDNHDMEAVLLRPANGDEPTADDPA